MSQQLPTSDTLTAETMAILSRLGVGELPTDGTLVARSPITGAELARLHAHSPADVTDIVGAAHDAFKTWRTVPAPVRGALVRELGELLREHKDDLGALVSIEAGKIRSEGLGEVQEMIDICDLAVGQSRQLFGLTIASERPGHRMMEQWHPLGVVGVISAFNFPVAVWSWNAALALVCGDAVVWKPSEKTLLTAVACHALAREAARRAGAPEDVVQLVLGGREVGEALVDDRRVPVVSATGSTRMGRNGSPMMHRIKRACSCSSSVPSARAAGARTAWAAIDEEQNSRYSMRAAKCRWSAEGDPGTRSSSGIACRTPVTMPRHESRVMAPSANCSSTSMPGVSSRLWQAACPYRACSIMASRRPLST